MTPAQARDVLKEELARIAPEVDFDGLDPAADFRDQTDTDSIDFLNLVTALHQRLDLDVPETDYPRFETLDGAIAYLVEKT